MPEQPIAALLRDLVENQARGSNRQLAAYLGVSNTALDRWLKGLSIPDPPYCWKIAERAHLPICDVMRMAGHLPPLDERTRIDQEPIPMWFRNQLPLFNELDAQEGEALALSARALLELREARRLSAMK